MQCVLTLARNVNVRVHVREQFDNIVNVSRVQASTRTSKVCGVFNRDGPIPAGAARGHVQGLAPWKSVIGRGVGEKRNLWYLRLDC
jgi:hypothetical protein